MLLPHAKALAAESVIRNGMKFPKNGVFSREQQAAEDWEPFREPVAPPDPGDCGCGAIEEEAEEEEAKEDA